MSTVQEVKPRRHLDESWSSSVDSIASCMQSPHPHHHATSVNIQPQHLPNIHFQHNSLHYF